MYASPRDFGHVLTIALAVQEAEKQERFNESLYTKFDNWVRLSARSPSRSGQGNNISRRSPDAPAVNHLRSQRYKPPHNASKPPTSTTRNVQAEAAIRCYECEGLGHFGRKCTTRRKKKHNLSDTPGKSNPNVRSVRVLWGISHSKLKVGKSEGKRKIKETSKRWNRRQLLPPQRPW